MVNIMKPNYELENKIKHKYLIKKNLANQILFLLILLILLFYLFYSKIKIILPTATISKCFFDPEHTVLSGGL